MIGDLSPRAGNLIRLRSSAVGQATLPSGGASWSTLHSTIAGVRQFRCRRCRADASVPQRAKIAMCWSALERAVYTRPSHPHS